MKHGRESTPIAFRPLVPLENVSHSNRETRPPLDDERPLTLKVTPAVFEALGIVDGKFGWHFLPRGHSGKSGSNRKNCRHSESEKTGCALRS